MKSETVIRDAGRAVDGRASGGILAAGLGAVGSIFAASSCCLPVLPFLTAAGVAGGSAFLTAARPYLLGLSIVLIAMGFYQASRARACRRKTSIIGSIVLWSSTLFVAVSVLFPQVMANAAAAWLGG